MTRSNASMSRRTQRKLLWSAALSLTGAASIVAALGAADLMPTESQNTTAADSAEGGVVQAAYVARVGPAGNTARSSKPGLERPPVARNEKSVRPSTPAFIVPVPTVETAPRPKFVEQSISDSAVEEKILPRPRYQNQTSGAQRSIASQPVEHRLQDSPPNAAPKPRYSPAPISSIQSQVRQASLPPRSESLDPPLPGDKVRRVDAEEPDQTEMELMEPTVKPKQAALQPPLFTERKAPPSNFIPPTTREIPDEEPLEVAPPRNSKPAVTPVEIIEPLAPAPAPKPIQAPAPREMPKSIAKPARPPRVEQTYFQQGGAADPPMEKNPLLANDKNFEEIKQTGELEVNVGRNLLLRTKQDIYRIAVVDPRICEVVQFTPREVSLIGKGSGPTNVTFWFRDGDGIPVTYLVKVAPDPMARKLYENQFNLLEELLRKLYPDSKVYLTYVANKLIVRGQAKDIEEAAQVMTVIRGQANGNGGRGFGNAGRGLADGAATEVLSPEETGRPTRQRIQIVNMLRVPGVQQVALRVKIAELNRTAARGLGIDVNARIDFGNTTNGNALFVNSLLGATSGGAPTLLAQFDGDDIQVGINYLQQRGVVRLLSEPTVVTMSGQQTMFHAGGEFAVPTVVGTGGLNAITTDFRSFGAVLSCLPTVVDKDRIRMQISPEFSQVNTALSVGGTPGLSSRSVTTTVEMREGQTLAIAGLLEDNMTANTTGNVPGLSWLFGNRSVSRNQTELIILVTPELVHPMEPDEVPPLPGFDVTEPTNGQFFLMHRLEGNPTLEYDSTLWPGLRHRYRAGGSSMISGPFGHGK